MRKTFSVLDLYGGVTQQFTGTEMVLTEDCVKIYDTDEISGYLKAVHRLAPGSTVCHTQEITIDG